jgi:hypothetical protein
MEYIHLKPNSELPNIAHLYPFKAVVLIDDAVLPEWQAKVSSWLVLSGCRYMMAWGRECSSWDDSVDEASIAEFEFREKPDCNFVLTTWHENEPMNEVFWYAKNTAFHPVLDLKNAVVVHIANMPRKSIENEFENA